MTSTNEPLVVVTRASVPDYRGEAPFDPAGDVPEYGFGETGTASNPAYDTVRRCFAQANLDRDRFGTPDWNPLAGLIRPGETVLLKPNFVKQDHPRDPLGWRYVLTHGSVIRAVADYVWKAVGNDGKVVVADAPQTDSSFTEVVRVLGLGRIRDFYVGHGLDFQLVDLRPEEHDNRGGVIVGRRRLPGDPYAAVAWHPAAGARNSRCASRGDHGRPEESDWHQRRQELAAVLPPCGTGGTYGW